VAIELLCRHRQRSGQSLDAAHAQGVRDAEAAFERLLGGPSPHLDSDSPRSGDVVVDGADGA
jgi:hypothetical protein